MKFQLTIFETWEIKAGGVSIEYSQLMTHSLLQYDDDDSM